MQGWWSTHAEKLLKREFWAGVLNNSGPSDGTRKYTLEELQSLYDILDRNPVVSEGNRAVVVETIRSIAEFMIWGDQHEPRIFDFLMENNIMAYLHNILQPAANRTGAVAKQVLQTLSIIVQNIRSETGIFFLFSNNHINHIVETVFDFEDEEVLGFFISFLKAISLKLSPQTVQFFIIAPDDSSAGPQHQAPFESQQQHELPRLPLYTEAVKLAHHKEGMVRAGVRTLTLSVYSLRDPAVQQLLTTQPAAQYFEQIVHYMTKQLQVLQSSMLEVFNSYSAQALSQMDSELAELEDMLAYCHDVLETAHPRVCKLLSQQLWEGLMVPHLLSPIEAAVAAGPSVGSQQLADCAIGLYALERCFLLLGCNPMLNNLALAVLGLPPVTPAQQTTPATHTGMSIPTPLVKSLPNGKLEGAAAQQHHHVQVASCRQALLANLSAAHPLVSTAVCRMLVALQRSKGLSSELQILLGIHGHSLADAGTPTPETQVAAARVLHVLGQVGPQVSETATTSSSSSADDVSAQQQAYTQYAYLDVFSCPSKTASFAVQAVLQPAATVAAPWPNADDGAAQPTPNHLSTAQPSSAIVIAQVVEDVLQGLVTDVVADAEISLAADSSTHQPTDEPQQCMYSLSPEHSPDHIGTDILAALLTLLSQPRVPVYTLQLAAHILLTCFKHKLPPPPAPVAPSPTPPATPTRRGTNTPSPLTAASSPLSSSAAATGSPAGSKVNTPRASFQPTTIQPSSSNQGAQVLGPELSALLMSALTSAASGVAEQLDRCWPDAFFPIFHIEWTAAEAGIRHPVLHPNADQLMTGPYMQLADQATFEAMGLGVTAIQALQLCHAVQRFATLLRLCEALQLLARSPASSNLMAWMLSDLSKAWVDVLEGQQVALSKANSVPCQVCFKPPDPVHVNLAVAGDAAKVVLAQQTDQPLRFKGILLHASPTVVLAQCANNVIDAGFVVSTAPLLGSMFHADAKVSVWLHVIVRPAVQSLVKQVKRAAVKKGGLASCLRSLSDGHWILQFPEDKRVNAALHLVDAAATAARRTYKDLIGSFLNAWLDSGVA